MMHRDANLAVAQVVADAGGELVGRTRLQKIVFLSQLAGFGDDFAFEYRHYGPYSEDLAQAMEIAVALGPIVEEERPTDWGGRYSIFSLRGQCPVSDAHRAEFVQQAKRIDAVELELAATAAYLFAVEGIGSAVPGNPWEETRRRKPSKAAGGRLERAVKSYESLRKSNTVRPLPELPNP